MVKSVIVRRLGFTLVLALAAGCGVEPVAGETKPPDPVMDIRVPVPEAASDYVDIVTQDLVINPGEDTMLCQHVTTDRELIIDTFVGLQGAGGHHIALFTTTEPKESGTLEDCSTPDSNRPLQWFINTLQLPAGDALRVPAGMHLVMQFHYINSGDEPILIRDVGRIHTVPEASVSTWITSLIAQDFDLDLPPGNVTRSWECAVPFDRDIVAVLGHMHEAGASFKLEVDGTSIYEISSWKPSFRDNSPVSTFYDAPLHIPAGSKLRTTCEWNNLGSTPIPYPVEMCLTFAYVAGGSEPYQCLPTGS